MIRNITILLLLSLSYSQPATEWTQVNIPSNQNIVKLISDGNGLYGATSTASIYFSSDNGLNWESLPLHPDIFPYGVDLFDKVDDYLFFSQNIGGSTYNYRTYYNGENWEDWEILPYDESIIYEFVHYDNTIYALLNQGISVSSDYGTSWELIDTPSITGYIHLQYVDDQYLYINHGCILYRYNIETFEWVDITGILDDIGPPEPYSCTSIHQIEKFNDKLLISMYWYGGVGTLFYSQNNGDSWEIINSFPSLSNSGYGTNNVSAVATKNGILYAGTATSEDGIYYTQNLIDWTEYSAGLSNYNLSVSALTVTEENIYKLGGSVNLFQNELIGVCDEGYTEIDGECYYQSDLDVLNIFIDNSPDINPILDTNNNGNIESLEFCSQIWTNGRLILLDCGPIIIEDNYNWLEISGEVPSNIENWSEIEILIMSYNNLSGLVPDNICELNLNFNDPNIFSFYGNDLCPPYPECIEDYIGTQSNWGSGSCELSNCYDVGVTQITALELYGDDLINPYDDLDGSAHLLVTMHNDGPHCSQYPGLMITADIDGTSFPTEENESSVNWWYAMFADDTYFSDITFEISPYIPPGTEITLTARSVIMGCLNEGCSEDPYCHDCPLTDPMSITLTIGDLFPSQLGDSNFDGTLNILDIVLVVSLILNNTTYPPYNEENAMEIYLSNINQDNNIDVLDVVMLVDIILNP